MLDYEDDEDDDEDNKTQKQTEDSVKGREKRCRCREDEQDECKKKPKLCPTIEGNKISTERDGGEAKEPENARSSEDNNNSVDEKKES